ncbi:MULTISPECIES: DUF928 domain-containing protein [Calothrix]|uniref:DUF928 domain-containing protein n=2 Tax=Calothrix TaxID=1186 RepID=A0ABR8ACP8_9CYAN|nr:MULTISPECIES: DUF928 domain-containing protein [Calothrix]MBD2197673.1 DUF928 domain-containing protein [Calothrix parietina FACHB-288]MBD2225602.1 DUF928 domain-containing protein [Calothrix anomala FACHB-343]
MQLYGRKLQCFRLKPLLLVSLGIYSLFVYPKPVLAESNNSHIKNSQQQQKQVVFIPPPPPDRGTPPASEGTGSRGDCLYQSNKPPLTALVGTYNLQLTVDEKPKLWVYIPYTNKEAPEAEFSLQDGENEVYRTRFQLAQKSGIFRINLPSHTSPLEVNKQYRWYVDINCSSAGESQQSSNPASLTGIVKRVEPSSALTRDLNSANTPIERIKIYAKHSIWLNTLTEIANLRFNEPENISIKQIWVDLLSQQQVGLEKIAQEPIAGDIFLSGN